MNKKFYFISGLPRSGSTLLSAILKQNSYFYADIISPVYGIVSNIINTLTNSETNILVEENKREKIIRSIFEAYYYDNNKSIIFDSSRAWTSKTSLLKFLFPYTKILCCVRNISHIINSFEIINQKNSLYPFTILDKNYEQNIFSRCDGLMDKNTGIVSTPLIHLMEGYALNKEMIMLIEYEKLCKFPQETIESIYKFLNEPRFNHDFENINYENERFDLSCNLKNLHTVKKEVKWEDPKIIIPKEIMKRINSMNLEFWKQGHEINLDIIDTLDKKFFYE